MADNTVYRSELACYWLCGLIDLGMAGLKKFVELCGGIERVLDTKPETIRAMKELSPKFIDEIIKSREITLLEEEYNRLQEKDIHFVGKMNDHFPSNLRNIENCPFGLFYRGKLPDSSRLSIAVVGARAATAFGQETARYFSRVLSSHGVQIISGLALGIDGYAHRGALEGGGQTWGILGCGVDFCYPKENFYLYEAMKKQGGVLSEFKPKEKPMAWHFPYRNRIISGLCDGILVVEARKKSGSLITAGLGLDQGKDIFAVPGRPVDELSAGCNSLISDGAKLVNGPEDILEEYKISVKLAPKNKIVLDNLEKLVYPSLCLDAKSIEQVAVEAQLDYVQTAKALLSLSDKGLARQVGKNYYISKL